MSLDEEGETLQGILSQVRQANEAEAQLNRITDALDEQRRRLMNLALDKCDGPLQISSYLRPMRCIVYPNGIAYGKYQASSKISKPFEYSRYENDKELARKPKKLRFRLPTPPGVSIEP